MQKPFDIFVIQILIRSKFSIFDLLNDVFRKNSNDGICTELKDLFESPESTISDLQ